MSDLDQSARVVDVFEVGPASADVVAEAMAAVDADPYQSFEKFVDEARLASGRLPAPLLAAVASFKADEGAGSLLIRGLPIPGSLPATPTAAPTGGPAAMGTERLLLSVGVLLGEPFTYAQWDGGLLVHNKYPIPKHRDIQFGSNAVEFLLHTETPFRDVSPDYLCLLCLRGDPSGEALTIVSDLARAIGQLDPTVRDVLRRAAFAFETDNPVIEVDGRGLTQPHPILSDRIGTEVPEYVGDLVATGPEEQDALLQLRRLVDASATGVSLEQGDLLILNNRRVVHGRTAFQPRYDGNDRWLQRMLFTTRGVVAPGRRLVNDTRYVNYPTFYQEALSSPQTQP